MKRILATIVVLVASAVTAPAAWATIMPTVTLDQSAGTAAGSTVNLGLDLKFAPSGSDSPKDLTLSLPPGLLADASIDGGRCLRSAAPIAACKVGSGTVSASPILLGLPTTPISISVTFYLVTPPAPGDLAGLAIVANGSPLGTPGAITVRSSTDPAGVGLNIAFSNLPDQYLGLPIAVDELSNTFDGLRLPARCATPGSISVSVDSYGDPSPKTTATPLTVTGCDALPYAPAFHVTAAKDQADKGVQVTTDITQNANEATSSTVALALPAAVLAPNAGAVVSGGILCGDPTFIACKTIGSASSTSPLYPTPLTGMAYLTGSLAAPAITIVFPAPFSLTLEGTVDLAKNTTTFTNLPDIPLTDLEVSLAGGPDAVFATTCVTPSGIATATLTSQNGDKTVAPSSAFSVSNCTTPAAGGGPAPTPPGPKPHPTPAPKSGPPRITSASLSGLVRGRVTLRLKLASGLNAPQLRAFTIRLPRGLSFIRHRVRRRLKLEGVSLANAKIQSLALRHGSLVIRLRRPTTSLRLTVHANGLKESVGLKHKARHHRIKSLRLTVAVTDVTGRTTGLRLQIRGTRLS